MLEVLAALGKFALICVAFGAVLGAGYVVTRKGAVRAASTEDDSPGATFFLWLHHDLCPDGSVETTASDASDGGPADD